MEERGSGSDQRRSTRRPVVKIASSLVTAGLLASGCADGTTLEGTTASDQPVRSASSSPSPTTTATLTPPTTEPTSFPASEKPAAFTSSERPATAADLGVTWRPGCPVGPEQLTVLTLSYLDFGGAPATGELVVATTVAAEVTAAFEEIYDAGFPIRKMININAYAGDDDASMADDNTSAFNCRDVTGGSGWSQHAYGLAIDINPLENPYVIGNEVLPPAGRDYLDRSNVRPGMIVEGDVVVTAFTSRGFEWGGRWSTTKDYQHLAVPR